MPFTIPRVSKYNVILFIYLFTYLAKRILPCTTAFCAVQSGIHHHHHHRRRIVKQVELQGQRQDLMKNV